MLKHFIKLTLISNQEISLTLNSRFTLITVHLFINSLSLRVHPPSPERGERSNCVSLSSFTLYLLIVSENFYIFNLHCSSLIIITIVIIKFSQFENKRIENKRGTLSHFSCKTFLLFNSVLSSLSSFLFISNLHQICFRFVSLKCPIHSCLQFIIM